MANSVAPFPTITFVKKTLADGSPCKKCNDVTARLESSGQMQHISKILVAEESNPDSEGMQLASKLNIDKAPFFIVEYEGEEPQVFTIYFKLVKDILNKLD
ncbi:hypothetical protein [Spongorhabdus nitratireducens]